MNKKHMCCWRPTTQWLIDNHRLLQSTCQNTSKHMTC